jgi:hypothetical protein
VSGHGSRDKALKAKAKRSKCYDEGVRHGCHEHAMYAMMCAMDHNRNIIKEVLNVKKDKLWILVSN